MDSVITKRLEIRKLVEQTLAAYPRARQDDKYLQLKVWHAQGLPLTLEFVEMFLSKKVASAESIRRYRQKLQEGGHYLPAAEVTKARDELAEATRQTIATETVTPIQEALL